MQLNSLFTFLGMNASTEGDADAHAGAQQKSSGFGAMLASTLAMLSQKGAHEAAGDSNLPGENSKPDASPAQDAQVILAGQLLVSEEETSTGERDIPEIGPGAADETSEGEDAESSDVSPRKKKSEGTEIGPLFSPSTEPGVEERHRHVTRTGEGDGADGDLLKRSADSGSRAGNDSISEERLAPRDERAAGVQTAQPVRPDGSAEQAVEPTPVDPKILLETASETTETASTGQPASADAPLPRDADLQDPVENTAPANDTVVDKRRGSSPADHAPANKDTSGPDHLPATKPDVEQPATGNRPLQAPEHAAATAGTLADAESDDIRSSNGVSDGDLRPNPASGDASTADTAAGRTGKNTPAGTTSASPPAAEPTLGDPDTTQPSKFDEEGDGERIAVQREAGSSSRPVSSSDAHQPNAATDRQHGAGTLAGRQNSTEQAERLKVADLERASHRRPAERFTVWQETSTTSSTDVNTADTSATVSADDLKPSSLSSTAAAPEDVKTRQTDGRSELRTGTVPGANTEAKADVTIDSKAEAKADVKIDPRAEAKADVKIVAGTEATAELKQGDDNSDTKAPNRSAHQTSAPAAAVADADGGLADAIKKPATAEVHIKEADKITADDAQKSAKPPTANADEQAAASPGVADNRDGDGESRADSDRSSSRAAAGTATEAGNTATGDGGTQNDFMGGSDAKQRDAFAVAAEELSPEAVEFEAALQDESLTVDAEVPVDVQNPETTEKLNFTPERTPSTVTTSSNPLGEVDRTARSRQPGSLNWMRAKLEDGLNGLTLEDDWKVLEMKLDEGQGTMTVRARRDDDKVTISVNFTDPQLRALAIEQADRLQETLRAQYATHVDFSLMNDNAGNSQQRQNQAPGGRERGIDSATPARGHSLSGADRARATRAALAGARNEWIG